MADPKLTLTFAARDLASRQIGKLHRSLGGLHQQVGRLGGQFVRLGKLAAAAAIGGIALLAGALGYAARQSALEEIGIKRLDASLRANIKGWGGNTDAIEKHIAEQARLGFADDELRDSLSQLVVGTHSVSKAQKLQSLAMDLARLKGIKLSDATKIVMKVSKGNTGILKRYGIEVKKGATATEGLAAIQKASAGQAEAYGKTTAGAFASLQIVAGNLVEDLGTAVMPILRDAAIFLRDTVAPAIGKVVDKVKAWFTENKPLIDQISGFVGDAFGKFVGFIGDIAPKLADIAGNIAKWAGEMAPLVKGLAEATTTIIINGITTLFDAFKNSGPIGPILAVVAGGIWAVNAAVTALGANPYLTAVAAFLLTVGAISTIEKAQAALKNAGGVPQTLLPGRAGGVIVPGPTPTFNRWPTTSIDSRVGGRASGGPVMAGGSYMVGERGPEMLTMGRRGGHITPNVGGQPVIVQLVADGRVLAQLVDKHLHYGVGLAATTLSRT